MEDAVVAAQMINAFHQKMDYAWILFVEDVKQQRIANIQNSAYKEDAWNA